MRDFGGPRSHVSDPVHWDEICRRFPDQWIVLVELDWTDERGEDIRIAFVAGSGGKREALAAARPLLGVFDKLGSFYTGAAKVPWSVQAMPIVFTTADVADPVRDSEQQRVRERPTEFLDLV